MIASWSAVDDRGRLVPGDRIGLVIEEDTAVARNLVDGLHALGWKAVVAPHGDAGLGLAAAVTPSAIVLDLRLPDVDGWVVLDMIEGEPSLRHVPVLLVGDGDDRRRARAAGALGAVARGAAPEVMRAALVDLTRLAESPPRRLLSVGDEAEQRAVREILGGDDVMITRAFDGEAALGYARAGRFECAIVHGTLADMSGLELLSALAEAPGLDVPVVFYATASLAARDEAELRRLRDLMVVVVARTPEQVLDQTSLLLHRPFADMPADRRQVIEDRRQRSSLAGAKILVVDDDIRNIFAVASALERQRATVLHAENGSDGLALLDQQPDVEVVLMDIMMPEMDGYQVIGRIRAQDRFRDLPIIALTAKAMKADRDRCIRAGASDYIAKPVDIARLLSMIRVHRAR